MTPSLDQLAALLDRPDETERSRRFEAAAIESGLPWRTSAGELASLYGVGRWRGFHDAVFLPARAALGLEPSRFFLLHEPAAAALPPREFQTDFNRHGNFRRNHEHAISTIAKLTGQPPEIRDTFNCLVASWNIGLFQVELHSFLREQTQSSGNVLYANNPDLWDCTGVRASVLLALRDPDESLADLVRFPHMEVRSGEASIGYGSYETGRLLPQPLHGAAHRVWSDGARLGVANRRLSKVLRRADVEALLLEEIEPARGPGSATIMAIGPDSVRGTPLFSSLQWDGLRDLAARMAKFLDLPLQTASYPDC